MVTPYHDAIVLQYFQSSRLIGLLKSCDLALAMLPNLQLAITTCLWEQSDKTSPPKINIYGS